MHVVQRVSPRILRRTTGQVLLRMMEWVSVEQQPSAVAQAVYAHGCAKNAREQSSTKFGAAWNQSIKHAFVDDAAKGCRQMHVCWTDSQVHDPRWSHARKPRAAKHLPHTRWCRGRAWCRLTSTQSHLQHQLFAVAEPLTELRTPRPSSPLPAPPLHAWSIAHAFGCPAHTANQPQPCSARGPHT